MTAIRTHAGPTSRYGLRLVVSDDLGERVTDWDALACSARLPSPFLTSWWLEAMATEGSASFVLCLESDRLVGGIALSVRTLGPLTFVRMLGDGPLAPDHLDLLAAEGREREVAAALRGWLMARSPCTIDLRGLADGALVLGALPPGSLVTQLSTAPYLQLGAAGPIEPKVRRGNVRRQVKRFGELGAVHRIVPGGDPDTERALRDLRRLHVERWGDRSGLARGFPAFAAAVHSSRGAVQMEELLVDDEVVASQVSVDMADRRHLYQSGRSMDPRWDGSGNVLLTHAIHRGQEDALAEYDFLRGAEPYKYMWATGERRVLRARAAVGTAPLCLLEAQRLAEHGRPAARQLKAWLRSRRAGRGRPGG